MGRVKELAKQVGSTAAQIPSGRGMGVAWMLEGSGAGDGERQGPASHRSRPLLFTRLSCCRPPRPLLFTRLSCCLLAIAQLALPRTDRTGPRS